MTVAASRQSEGVMMVVQNNDLQALWVSGANEALLDRLGYATLPEEAPFALFLGEKTRALIEEDVEFEDDAKDVMQVLSRLREVWLRTAEGIEVPTQCTVSRSVAQDRHHLFRMVFFSTDHVDERKADIRRIKDHFNLNHTLDDATRLPDTPSLLRYMALTRQFSAEHQVNACFVYMQLSLDPSFASSLQEEVLHHVGQVIARNLRIDDTIGRIAQDALGILLIDINKTTVHLALNRIRHMLATDPYQMEGTFFTPQVRQAAIMLEDGEPQETVDMCVALLREDPASKMILFKGAHPTNPFQAD